MHLKKTTEHAGSIFFLFMYEAFNVFVFYPFTSFFAVLSNVLKMSGLCCRCRLLLMNLENQVFPIVHLQPAEQLPHFHH